MDFRRWAALLLAVAALLLAACAGGTREEPPAPVTTSGADQVRTIAATAPAEQAPAEATAPAEQPSAEEPSGTIIFVYPGEETEQRMRPEIIRMFNEQYPNITVQEQPVRPDGYDQQILAAIAAGTPPDVFVSGDVFVAPFIKNKVARDLTPFFEAGPDLKEDAFCASVMDYFRGPDGHVCMMPDTIDVQRIYYNKELFDAAGEVVPTPDWTWDDFKNAAAKLTQGEGPEKQYGFVTDTWWAVWLPYVWQNGGDILRITLPLSRSALAIVAVFTFMATWSDFLWPLLMLQTPEKYTLTLGLAATQGRWATRWPELMAGTLMSIVPILLLLVFFQRYFEEGIALTGIKT